MKTLLLSALDAETPQIAADLIRRGELVAIPTETVYGGRKRSGRSCRDENF